MLGIRSISPASSLVHELGEGATDVFVLPAGRVVRKRLEVFVTPAREAFARRAFLETPVADEPANADRFDLLIRVAGIDGGGHGAAQHGKCGKHDDQGTIYS